jgi:hypothetical protein
MYKIFFDMDVTNWLVVSRNKIEEFTRQREGDLPEDGEGLRGVGEGDVLQVLAAVGEFHDDELLRLRLAGKQRSV